jgi:hypothetical protein
MFLKAGLLLVLGKMNSGEAAVVLVVFDCWT